MALDIYLISEREEKLEILSDSRDILSKYIQKVGKPQFENIQYIDLYGNTIFNNLQMYGLIEDIKSLLKMTIDMDDKIFLEQLQNLAIKCKNTVHTYLKFVGD